MCWGCLCARRGVGVSASVASMFFSKAQTQSSLPNIHSEQNFQGKSCVSIKSERNALLFVCKGGKHPLGQGAWGGWWGPLLSGEPRFRGDSVAIDKAVRALDLASRRPEGTGLTCFPVKSVRGFEGRVSVVECR